MGEKKDLKAIGLEILDSARSELYLNLPYLDAALCALAFESGEGKTLFTATDGEHLYYDGNYLAERFLRSRTLVNRIYLHSILHCMLRHLGKKRGKAPELWDLSCDIAVESILDGLDYPCLSQGTVPAAGDPVRPAAAADAGAHRRGYLSRLFAARRCPPTSGPSSSGSSLWTTTGSGTLRSKRRRTKRQDSKWKERVGADPDGPGDGAGGPATGGEAVLEQMRGRQPGGRGLPDVPPALRGAPGGDGRGRRRLRLHLLHLRPAALRQHAPGGAAGDQGGEADRGLRHRGGYLHVHLRSAGAGVFGLYLCHFAQHGDLHPEGEHPHSAVRRPGPQRTP